VICPKCATSNAPGATHCSNCGSELVALIEPSLRADVNYVLAFFLFFVGLIAGLVGFVLLVTLDAFILDAWAMSHRGSAASSYMSMLWVVEAVLVGAGAIALLVRAKPPLPVASLIVGAAVAIAGGLAVCGSVNFKIGG